MLRSVFRRLRHSIHRPRAAATAPNPSPTPKPIANALLFEDVASGGWTDDVEETGDVVSVPVLLLPLLLPLLAVLLVLPVLLVLVGLVVLSRTPAVAVTVAFPIFSFVDPLSLQHVSDAQHQDSSLHRITHSPPEGFSAAARWVSRMDWILKMSSAEEQLMTHP